MDAATRAIAAGLKPGTLVSYETTLPVGTTRNRWAPMLEQGSGLTVGTDFSLVFSPERVLTGRVFADLRRYPKLVGGVDDGLRRARRARSTRRCSTSTSGPTSTGPTASGTSAPPRPAELAKLAETTYRDVNIGLANQFARFADTVGVDVTKVIEACNTQPYSHIHSPGIAVGGHCIPIYPRMYLWNDPAATVVRSAREANAAMPDVRRRPARRRVRRPDRRARAGARRRLPRRASRRPPSPGSSRPSRRCAARGATPYVSDPMYTAEELAAHGLPPHEGQPVTAAVVQADHAEYRSLTPADLPGVRVLVDGRRVTDPQRWTGVRRVVIGG